MALGQLSQGAESICVARGDVGQHLAIHLHVGLLKSVDEMAVFKAVEPGGGIDAGNPQPPKIPLAGAAVAIGISKRFEHRLVGALEQLGSAAELPLGELKHLLMAPVRINLRSGTCHQLNPRV